MPLPCVPIIPHSQASTSIWNLHVHTMGCAAGVELAVFVGR